MQQTFADFNLILQKKCVLDKNKNLFKSVCEEIFMAWNRLWNRGVSIIRFLRKKNFFLFTFFVHSLFEKKK